MQEWRLRAWPAAALLATLCAYGPACGDEPSRLNRMTGIVVFRDSGEPAVGVTVVMAHGQKGYIYFFDDGLFGGGDRGRVLLFFTKRNAAYYCEEVTDREGRFTMTNFAAPQEIWHVAAGNPDRGWAIKSGIRPADFTSQPLRIEIEKGGYVSTTIPPAPSKRLQTYVSVSLVPPEPTGAADDSNASEPAATPLPLHFAGTSDYSGGGKTTRVGPLPAGYKYRLAAQVSGQKLPYSATVFARTVGVSAGETKEASLTPDDDGMTVSGTVTSTEDKPLADVNVMVQTSDGVTIGTLTDKDGKYELRGVPAGEHRLELLRHAVRKGPG